MFPAPSDRRAAPRLRPALATTCRFDPGGDPDAPAHGLVWNISRSGVSMLVAAQPTAGAVLSGELRHERGGTAVPVLLRVVRLTPTATGDHLLAGQFLRELSPAELHQFTDPDAAEV